MLSPTTGAPGDAWLDGGRLGDLMGVPRPIHRGIFEFVGCDVPRPQLGPAVARVGASERAAMLDDWRRRVAGLFEEAPVEVGAYGVYERRCSPLPCRHDQPVSPFRLSA
jgi:NAD(P)H dehydrogenase (quinone)